VSLDLSTARHPQTLLATHLNGKALTVEHGAPLRLVAPVKLGLKNIKAITRISYTETNRRTIGQGEGIHGTTGLEFLSGDDLRGG
jgi:DMSO/TMAO reductase YedYZ molybdopterin-dependent catalytic subunit